MSAAVGQLSFPPKEETQFKKPYSESTATVIDAEVRKIVDECYARTLQLLAEKQGALKSLAEVLLQKETINSHDLVEVLGQRPFPVNEGLRQYLDTSWKRESGAQQDEDSDTDTQEAR
jgi:AFG3 family protein